MNAIDVYKLRTEVQNYDLSKNNQISVNTISKNWIAMEDKERNYYHRKLDDIEDMMKLFKDNIEKNPVL